MTDVILFGGTTEGRELTDLLVEENIPALICVVTEYGKRACHPAARVHVGQLSREDMETLFRQEQPRLVLDATHPYAVQVSEAIGSACEATQCRYVRVRRETYAGYKYCLYFSDMPSLVAWLNTTEGVIFSTMGAKEAEALRDVRDYQERVFLRLLPAVESVATCTALGYPGRHLYCMQGPFSEEFNQAQFLETGAKILVTKESGPVGGLAGKVEAAKACGMTVAILARPAETGGISFGDAKRLLQEVFL